eukprot:s4907_g8.t1
MDPPPSAFGAFIQWTALVGVQTPKGVPFRPIHEDRSWEGVGVERAVQSSIVSLLRRPAAQTPQQAGFGGPHSRQQQQQSNQPRQPTQQPIQDQVNNQTSSGDQDLWHEGKGPENTRPKAPKRHLPASDMSRLGRFGKLRREGSLEGGFSLPLAHEETEESGKDFETASEGPSVCMELEKGAGNLAMAEHTNGPKDPPFLGNGLATMAPLDEPSRKKSEDRSRREKSRCILAIARRASSTRIVTAELEKGFSADSSRKAKKAIRNTILQVFREAKGMTCLPPSPEKLKWLAGILKAANYKAASSYLIEYRLMAIEAGHEWSQQLDRTLALCKRSVSRAIGPKKKAVEVPTNEFGEHFVPRVEEGVRKVVPLSSELFEFGVIWMLKEIELSAVRKSHIQLDFNKKRVRLTLPSSKTDQEGESVSRVVQCLCEARICAVSCPFFVAMRLLDRMCALNLDLACVTNKKKPATKAQLVRDWKKTYGTKVSGHTTRRTGALRYIRRGWAIAQVAYLGRWKSAVIYEYAREALESLPVNSGTTFGANDPKAPQNGEARELQFAEMEDKMEGIRHSLLAELE